MNLDEVFKKISCMKKIEIIPGNEIFTLSHGKAEILDVNNKYIFLKLRDDNRYMIGVDNNAASTSNYRHWGCAFIVDDMKIFRSISRAEQYFKELTGA